MRVLFEELLPHLTGIRSTARSRSRSDVSPVSSGCRCGSSGRERDGAGHPLEVTPMIETTVLLTEDAMARELAAALARHELPEKFFYWFPTSVRAWIDLCSDGAYRNFVRSQGLVDRHAPDVAVQLPDGPVSVVSLGAGQGVKDVILVDALRRAGHEVHYVPVDASQSLLEMACGAALHARVPCRGIKADLAAPGHLDAIADATAAMPRLFMLLGNTLGAFAAADYAAGLARLLRPGDHLLLDGEIYAETTTLAGYDNPLNRQFAFGPLRALGLCEPDDGTLVFNAGGTDRHGVRRLDKHFVPARDLSITVAGERVRWKAGARVNMNWSGKYDEGAFLPLLAAAGLETVAHYVSDDARFVMALTRRSSVSSRRASAG
jgi:uncharacterized SAM-dependent methyltransferase